MTDLSQTSRYRRRARMLAAWTLYRVGGALSHLDEYIFGHLYYESRWLKINLSLYPAYNWLWIKSDEIQGDDEDGPWAPVSQEEIDRINKMVESEFATGDWQTVESEERR